MTTTHHEPRTNRPHSALPPSSASHLHNNTGKLSSSAPHDTGTLSDHTAFVSFGTSVPSNHHNTSPNISVVSGTGCSCVKCECVKCKCNKNHANLDPTPACILRIRVGLPMGGSSVSSSSSFSSTSMATAMSSAMPSCVIDPVARSRCSANRQCALNDVRNALTGGVASVRGVTIVKLAPGNLMEKNAIVVDVIVRNAATKSWTNIFAACQNSLLSRGYPWVELLSDNDNDQLSTNLQAGVSSSSASPQAAAQQQSYFDRSTSQLTVASSSLLSMFPRWTETELRLSGLTCMSCVNAIARGISELPGIQMLGLENRAAVSVSLDPPVAVVRHDAKVLSAAGIEEKIQSIGYDVIRIKSKSVAGGGDERGVGVGVGAEWPPVQEEQSKKRTEIAIHGMTCASCVATLENILKALPGVESTIVTLLPQRAIIVHDAYKVSVEEITTKVDDVGYEVLSTKSEPVKSPALKAPVGSSTTLGGDDLEAGGPAKDDGGGTTTVEIGDNVAWTTTKLSVTGMTCAACVVAIETSVKRRAGVKDVSVSLMTHKATILHDPNLVGARDLIEMISDMGYDAALHTDVNAHEMSQKKDTEELQKYLRLTLYALTFAVPTIIVSMVIMMALPESNPVRRAFMTEILPGLTVEAFVGFLLATPVQFVIGWRFYRGAYKSLAYARAANMDVLVALGTTAAYLYSVYATLRSISLGMDTGGQYWETSVLLIFFILLGKFLECYAKGRTGEAVKKLLSLTPDSAILVQLDGNVEQGEAKILRESEITAGLIQVGDVLKVTPGSRFPCDAVVVQGHTHVDESMLTGEPIPQFKQRGDSVTGGTLNANSQVLVKATRVGSDTSLARIVQLVEDAQSSRAPIQAVADAIARVFVPAVVLIAVLTLIIWLIVVSKVDGIVPPGENGFQLAVDFAIAVLVIACPCALGLATPTAVMVGTGVAAKYGILIKGGGAALQMARNVRTIIFDKTGTLTKGTPMVTDSRVYVPPASRGLAPISTKEHVFSLIGFAESASAHPLATAAVAYATEHHPNLRRGELVDGWSVSDVTETPGMGLAAVISGSGKHSSVSYKVFVGSFRWVAEVNQCDQVEDGFEGEGGDDLHKAMDFWQSSGNSIVFVGVKEVGDDGQGSGVKLVKGFMIAALSISDPPRDTTRPAVLALKKMGVRVMMMTGDTSKTAMAVANRVGISEEDVIAGCLPQDKGRRVEAVRREVAESGSKYWGRKGTVAFAGDGINDSVALAQADVGIAMGAGSDIAIESASAVLLRSDLADIIILLSLSRKVLSRIYLNMFSALIYNLIGVPIAAGIFYPLLRVRLMPWMAGLAMALSSVSVVLSSLAIKGFKPPAI
ncbi:hypothetical protein HDU76_001326 [Blyttiomyces sp. JEL0837]|nr:hypothetical protein HDU76_001326 [Blyttiomyces sp. JEL0837]